MSRKTQDLLAGIVGIIVACGFIYAAASFVGFLLEDGCYDAHGHIYCD